MVNEWYMLNYLSCIPLTKFNDRKRVTWQTFVQGSVLFKYKILLEAIVSKTDTGSALQIQIIQTTYLQEKLIDSNDEIST